MNAEIMPKLNSFLFNNILEMESYYIRFTVLLLVWIFLQLGVALYFEINDKPFGMFIMLIIMVIPPIIYRMAVLYYGG